MADDLVSGGNPIETASAIETTAQEAALQEAVAAPEQASTNERIDLERKVEAVLMISEEPISLVSLASGLGAPLPAVRQCLERLGTDYDGLSTGGVRRGFELREVGGGWRIYVRAELDEVVRDFVATQQTSRLSQAALETLAVIAYRQPISRGAVAAIRAVNVDSVVRTLVSRGLITEAFTDPETGAIHYETTDLLLTQLGINSLDELPKISPLLEDGSAGFADGI